MPLPIIEACERPQLHAALLTQPYTVLLQSGAQHPLGTWSLLAQRPWQIAIVYGNTITVWNQHGQQQYTGNPWYILEELWRPWRQPSDERHPCPGGVFGYFGYECGVAELTHDQRPRLTGLPDAVVGWYREVIAWRDDEQHAWRGVVPHAPRQTVAPELDLPAAIHMAPSASLDQAGYTQRVERILEYIQAGDIYQANLTFHLQTSSPMQPWDVYQQVQQRTSAPFGAWIALPQATILSASPERFLWCSPQGYVETRPIKGTRPRGKTAAEDQALAAELQANAKERAENLMITDLLRNDIGKVCEIGSVHVPSLWSIETLPTVHHLVSTVTGQLRSDTSIWQLLQACWPGGSITGAPKKRAMEIIAELEVAQREIYCGAIGYCGFDGSLNTSIVIRTLIERQGLYTCGVGCGIVADSNPLSEYEEALLKGYALQKALSIQARSAR